MGKIQTNKEWSNEKKQTQFTNLLNDLDDSNKFKKMAQDFDILSGSVDKFSEESLVNLYASQIKCTTGFTGVNSIIKTFNANSDKSTIIAELQVMVLA